MTALHRLRTIMSQLRDPTRGCPWDCAQNYTSLVPHTLEEAYEVADAVLRHDINALRDELGDVLFQVLFYSQIAQEAGQFTFDDVAQAIADKLERRHPHVFGHAARGDSTDHAREWEAIKAAERAARSEAPAISALDGIPLALPGTTRARKLQNRAARVGFDWPDIEPVFAKLTEEINEVRTELANGGNPERLEDEVGDLLFVVVNLARHTQVDPEAALRRANAKFERRFRRIEALLAHRQRQPQDATLEEMDALWDQAKREERK